MFEPVPRSVYISMAEYSGPDYAAENVFFVEAPLLNVNSNEMQTVPQQLTLRASSDAIGLYHQEQIIPLNETQSKIITMLVDNKLQNNQPDNKDVEGVTLHELLSAIPNANEIRLNGGSTLHRLKAQLGNLNHKFEKSGLEKLDIFRDGDATLRVRLRQTVTIQASEWELGYAADTTGLSVNKQRAFGSMAISSQDDREYPDLITKTGWREYAKCKPGSGVDAALFFGPDGERKGSKARSSRELAAKRICKECTVVAKCLEYAMKNGIDDGIWGGLTPEDRKALARINRTRKII